MKKISICTVCMNRLHHLCQTLPRNIRENMDYPEVEFVVLNYNSRDGMDEWMMSNMKEYVESGILKYYKTDEPLYFDRSHSKNMALRLATGDYLGMVDADNYAGPGYVSWVQSVFAANGDATVITTIEKDRIPYKDQGGKVFFSRELLHTVHGFDESLVGYGIEDVDLVNRLEKAGGKRYFIKDEKYLEYIDHSTAERIENHHMINNLDSVYVSAVEMGGYAQKVLYLLNDGSFVEACYLFDNKMQDEWVVSFGGWTMKEGSHRQGTFQKRTSELELQFENTMDIFKKDSTDVFRLHGSDPNIYWKWIDKHEQEGALYNFLVHGYSECRNRLIYLQNDKNNNVVNPEGWGKGAAYQPIFRGFSVSKFK